MLVDAATGQKGIVFPLEAYTRVDAVALSPDGRSLAAATSKGLQIWTSDDWERSTPILSGRAEDGFNAAAFSPDGKSVATGSTSSVPVWDARTAVLKWRQNDMGLVDAVAFSSDGRILASGHPGGNIELWDAATGARLRTLWIGWVGSDVSALAFFRDGRLAAGSKAPGITIWDSTTGSLLRTLRTTSSVLWPGAQVYSIAISPDQSWIAVGESDRPIRIWNAKSDFPARTIFGHASIVTSVAISPDGTRLASGDYENIMHTWASSP